jgi:hypothetical protein
MTDLESVILYSGFHQHSVHDRLLASSYIFQAGFHRANPHSTLVVAKCTSVAVKLLMYV